MPLAIITGPFIQARASLSGVADCRAGPPVRLTMPGGWDAAPLTFQVSTDGKMFNELYDHHGKAISVVVVPGVGVIVPPGWLHNVAYVKFRSGTFDAPVPQSVLREFAIAIVTG